MEILLGSDPELFVYKDGSPISAHGMVNGTKDHPLIVQNGAVQVDGMALEYNTDPAATLAQWEKHHKSVQEQLFGMIENGLTLQATPTAFFAEEVFNTTPAEALVLGCEPDFNAYTGMANQKPDAEVNFRTGAGHIHIGWGNDFDIRDSFHIGECRALVKALDMFLGVPSVLMDGDTKRRELYGAAGCFRPKPYGLEYRTLSNFWVDTPELRAWAFNNTMLAIQWMQIPDNQYSLSSVFKRIINNNDTGDAEFYTSHYNIPVLEAA